MTLGMKKSDIAQIRFSDSGPVFLGRFPGLASAGSALASSGRGRVLCCNLFGFVFPKPKQISTPPPNAVASGELSIPKKA
jgi:hypothetical protein